jgi:hypothetical protein
MGQHLAARKTKARTTKSATKPAAPAAATSTDSNEQIPSGPAAMAFDREQAIREAAYACFEARGCEPGHALDDWLKAEAMVQHGIGGPEKPPPT